MRSEPGRLKAAVVATAVALAGWAPLGHATASQLGDSGAVTMDGASAAPADAPGAAPAPAQASPAPPTDAATRARQSKQFLRAYALAPDRYPDLEGLVDPAVELAVATRTRDGVSGTSHLQATAGVAAATVGVDEDLFRLRLTTLALDAGPLAAGIVFGSRGVARFAPTTTMAGVEPTLTWRRENAFAPYAELGSTPVGGAVGPTVVGRLGAHVGETWKLSGEIYRTPVADSILSYAGAIDPVTGRGFGRVVESGVRAVFDHAFADDWDANAGGSWGALAGRGVDHNTHGWASAGLSYDFSPRGFDTLAVGGLLGYDRYGKDLSGFALGQGGYFSPRDWERAGLEIEFRTPEARRFILHGDITPGWSRSQSRGQAADSGFGTGVVLEAIWRLTAHWAVGGVLHADLNPQYNDVYGGLALKFSFDRRLRLYSPDLPAAPLR